ncbi:MAG: protocatechuate 3,4-dioxygenase subunit alpha [Pseudomonadota bacterium]
MADMPGFGEMDLGDRGGQPAHDYGDRCDVAPSNGLTPSQTIGPFFAYGLTPGSYGYAFRDIHSASIAGPEVAGESILIEGQVFDGNGAAAHDAMVELVQADHTGLYADAPRNDGFTGYGRAGTGANGPAETGGDTRFQFRTVKPGPTQPGAAPFVTLILTMRGLLNHCVTRVYFPEDDHAADPVLSQVPAERRHTLVATSLGEGRYRFDIHMQGENETSFFDV